MITCGSCNHGNPASSKFCGECGTRLGPAPVAPSLFENLKRICFGQAPPVFAPGAAAAGGRADGGGEALGSPGFNERSRDRAPAAASEAATQAPAASTRRVSFAPEVEFQLVETLDEQPEEERRSVWWTHRDYQQIRARQRELILLVLKQAHDYPPGVVPPPIPGESRRGLGICCEPGTNSGRAARVKMGLRQIVRAHREGLAWGPLSELSAELSEWAASNAREVGLKDHSAVEVSDFARTFFLHGSIEAQPKAADEAAAASDGGLRKSTSDGQVSTKPATLPRCLRKTHSDEGLSSTVARASRRAFPKTEAAPGIGLSSGGAVARAQRHNVGDGEPKRAASDGTTHGLASMVRVDSLTNLAAATTAHLDAGAEARGPPPSKRDGLGLASMIRNDSLGNLQGAASRDALFTSG